MVEVHRWSLLSLLHELADIFTLYGFDVQPDKLAESFQYFLQGLGLGKSLSVFSD